MKKVLIIVICLVLIGAGFWFFGLPFFRNMKYRNDELLSCSSSYGGGMLGGYSSLYLRKDKNGKVILEVREKETHADREITRKYEPDPGALDHIGDMVSQYGLYAASKQPPSPFQVMDGDTLSVSFSFSKGSFYVSDTQALTSKESTGLREVRKYLSSLAAGDCITTVEPQTATLHLRSGYTLQFNIEESFDGKLDQILCEEREVSRFKENGIILCTGEVPDLANAKPVESAAAGTIVYDSETESIIILYTDYTFAQPAYVLAALDGYVDSACPLIAEMEGPYRMYLN